VAVADGVALAVAVALGEAEGVGATHWPAWSCSPLGQTASGEGDAVVLKGGSFAPAASPR
jgi:hypothetical protein